MPRTKHPPHPTLSIKRIYTPALPEDGTRVLVDRIWPRGVSKEKAHVDHWLKEIGPSTELRKWFGHDPAKWAEFKKRYERELRANTEVVAELVAIAQAASHVTLVYSARDEDHNQAVVVAGFLGKKLRGS